MRQIVQCAPNFSEGRREDVVAEIVAAIAAHDVQVLTVQADPDLNRSVISFVGELPAVEQAAYAGAEAAAGLIDMDSHEGEHPRIGAADVVPFIPVVGVSVGDCAALARRVGERIARELAIPVYLYGEAATSPERVALSGVRQHQYEDLKEAIAHDPSIRPDFGPLAVGSAGAAAVGARHPYVTLSVLLGTDRLDTADAVARSIREDSGGLAHVSAEGVDAADRGGVAIALTISRPDRTPIHRVMELIRLEAARHGAAVVSCELIGMAPQSVLLASAQWYLRLDQLTPEHVIESRLIGICAEGESSRAPRDFADAVASEEPSPGALAVAALVGALAASLSAMVANLTIGQDQFASLEKEMRRIRDEAVGLQQELLSLVEAEAAAYGGLVEAHRLPRNTPDESDERRDALQVALRRAVEVPIESMRRSIDVQRLARRVAEVGDVKAVAEAGTAGLMAHAAVRAAAMGLELAVRGLRDLEEGDGYRRTGRQLSGDSGELARETERVVQSRMAGA